jgi:hypothetical protein
MLDLKGVIILMKYFVPTTVAIGLVMGAAVVPLGFLAPVVGMGLLMWVAFDHGW